MMNKKPLILITNDDGYKAKGIQALTDALKGLGEIVVFAPESHRSGMSRAITPSVPLRVKLSRREEDLTVYRCSGTPVDCVKLAMHSFVDRQPDLLVSGINHGTNSAISVHYSGTMGAAIEGCIFGIPSIGFSLCSYEADADFSSAAAVARTLTQRILQEGLPEGICLNVNIPYGTVNGIRPATQTRGKWINEFLRSHDGLGREVFWLTGTFDNWEPENEESDEWALANGYAAVVPVRIDTTAHDYLSELRKMPEGNEQ